MESIIIGYVKCDMQEGDSIRVAIDKGRLVSPEIEVVITPFELKCIRLELKLKSDDGYQPVTNELDDKNPPQETSC